MIDTDKIDNDLYQLMCFVDDVYKHKADGKHQWEHLNSATFGTSYHYRYYNLTVVRIFSDFNIQVSKLNKLLVKVDFDINDPEFVTKFYDYAHQ